MSEPSLPEESIFAQALEIASTAERAAFLDRACDTNQALRAEVEALLRASERSGDLLDLPENPVLTTDLPAHERPGTVIGPYKLLEQVGEGGMGTVWMAEQTEPIKRRVAVKVVKEGMDSRQVLARFDAERQALALMEHPNIAKVLDAGKTPSGRPYFVMELVKGQPITKYCDEKRLGVRERLDLFGEVCRAVQHAHQKGIIHRDIKPSNVLVAPYDGKPVVKVIDFGVAKATGQRLTAKTLFTGIGSLVGTPEYMSPEQAEVNNQDIDTRSDIYSLGVVLYELLTGSTPLTRKRVKEAALLEVLRVIREEEPPRPSTRLSESKASLPSISAQRQTEPAKLTKLVRGELDWIVMKALEKDRNRRYESANGFAADVQRYLADEPVQACPPSAGYRLRKFARRNRAALATTVTVSVAVLVAACGIGWAVRDRAAAAERAAHDKAAQREQLEGRINQALEETKDEYEHDHLPEAHARLQRIDALLAGDTGVSDEVRHRADKWRAELAILQRLEDEALLPYESGQWLQIDAAYVRVFRDIGIDIDALPAEEAGRRIRTHLTWERLTEALDEWSLLRHEIAWNLKPPPPEALPRKLRLLQVARAADPDELRRQARLAAEKWDVAAAERLAGLPEVGRLPAAALRHLAMVIYYGDTGGNTQAGHDRAVRLLLNALVLRPGDYRLNSTCANWYGKMQPPRWAEAAHYLSIGVALRPENPALRLSLAAALRGQRRLDDAIAQLREAIRIKKEYSVAHFNLGYTLQAAGRLDEAATEFREVIRLEKNYAMAHNNLGSVLSSQGRLEEAVRELREAIRLDRNLSLARNNLVNALLKQGDRPGAAAALEDLGNTLRGRGDLPGAAAAFQRASALKADLAAATPGKEPPEAPNVPAGKAADDARVPSPVALLRTSAGRRDDNRKLRSAALHPPYVYVLDCIGDLWVFQLPAKAGEKPGQELQEVGHVPAAGDGNALVVIGDTLLCSRLGSLEAFSLQDPAQPRHLGKFGPAQRAQVLALVRDHDRLFLIGPGCLSVFDISQPATPRHRGTTQTPGYRCNGCVVGGRLYVAEIRIASMKDTRDGIAIYDLADPGALKEIGFVQTSAPPYHLLPVGPNRLAVLLDGGAQLCGGAQMFSLADPLQPVALGPPVATSAATSARSGTLFPIDGQTYLVTGSDVFRLEEKGLIPLGGFRAGFAGDGFPYQGGSAGGHAVISLNEAVVVLRPEARSAARLAPPGAPPAVAPAGPRVQVGQEMDLAGPTVAGGKFDLKQLRGKVVLIDFWATWCGPCVAELPNVKAVYDRHHADGFEVVGISLDHSREALTRFVKEKQIPWPQLFFEEKGSQGWDNPLARRYGVHGIPSTILVDRAGKVVQVGVRGEKLEPAVAKLLGKEPAPPK